MKLIMVDLDGTLFDTRMVNYRAYQEAIETYGYSIDYQYYCDFCNGRHYMEFLPQITTDNKMILSDMHKIKKQVYRKYLSLARVNEALVDLIKLSREKYRIALVTTASKENTYEILKQYDLFSIFDLILTHEDVIHCKPNPEGYLKAMNCFDAKPEESIIFEDSDVGVAAAEKTGARCFVVKGYN